MTELIATGTIAALTLLGLVVLSRGLERRLLTIGYGFLTLFSFKVVTVLLASLIAIALALWLRGSE